MTGHTPQHERYPAPHPDLIRRLRKHAEELGSPEDTVWIWEAMVDAAIAESTAKPIDGPEG